MRRYSSNGYKDVRPFYRHHGWYHPSEMMLLTHGAVTGKSEFTTYYVPPDCQVIFYSGHGSILKFDRAICKIREPEILKIAPFRAGEIPDAVSIASGKSPLWNYHLSKLKPDEFATVEKAFTARLTGANPWDWWTVSDESTTLEHFLFQLLITNAQYKVIHFLCCRFADQEVRENILNFQDRGIKAFEPKEDPTTEL